MSEPGRPRESYPAPMRLALKPVVRVFGLSVGLSVVGCSDPSTLPTTPNTSVVPIPKVPVAPVVPRTTNPSSAAVTPEDAFAIVYRQGSGYGYDVRFRLRETGGKSGATVDRIVVYGPSGSDEAASGCWRDPLRVAPLGQLDTFYTEEGDNWLSYCGPGNGGHTPTPLLHVIVTFTDDFGVVGAIDFPITSLR